MEKKLPFVEPVSVVHINILIGLFGLKRKEKSKNDDPERDWALLFKMGWDKLRRSHFMSILKWFFNFHCVIDKFIVSPCRPFAVRKYSAFFKYGRIQKIGVCFHISHLDSSTLTKWRIRSFLIMCFFSIKCLLGSGSNPCCEVHFSSYL